MSHVDEDKLKFKSPHILRFTWSCRL